MKRSFFQAAVVSILLYGYTTWTLTKRLEKKLDGNYTRKLRAILNTSWRQHPTKHQLYDHLPPITETIQIRRTRHAGHCWGSRDELIGGVLRWTPTYCRAKVGRPARTYIQHLCEDTGYSPEDLPEAMKDREKWWERLRDICAGGTTWWWWWWEIRETILFCAHTCAVARLKIVTYVTRWEAFVSVGVGVVASQRIPLSVLVRNPHKGLALEISDETGRGWGMEGPRVGRIEKWTEEGSRQKRAGDRACGVRCRVGQREKMSQHSWWLWGNFARIHARDSSQSARKVSQTSPFLSLELTQVRISLFSFLQPSRLCMSFFMCPHGNVKYPWPEMGETTRGSDGHE